MGIFSFLSKIGDGISSLSKTIGSTISHGYQEFKNTVSGVGHEIGTQVGNVANTVGQVAQTAINKGSELIQHTEDSIKSTITMPLILIAAGIGGLLLFNGKEVVQTAGTVAARTI